ncbi:MAG: glycosyltransferase family 39 protein, partial [Rhodospirillales bacterium]|nr:glycosyltransferase family 39 protein [Rhodospirillales bacterium]
MSESNEPVGADHPSLPELLKPGRAMFDESDARPGRTVLLLLAVLAICLPAMLVDLAARDSTHTMENIAVLSAQETWLRQVGYKDIEAAPDAWLMPTRNGEPRVTKPPMYVWTTVLGWIGLDPDTATAEQIIWRARFVSVVMGVVLIASIFWMGLSLEGRRLAVVAALAAGAMWFVQRQARTASYDIHMTAWVALSLAGALWAMKPLRRKAHWRRQVVGWGAAAFGLFMGFMSKQLALVVMVLPLVVFFVLNKPFRRWSIVFAFAAVAAGVPVC